MMLIFLALALIALPLLLLGGNFTRLAVISTYVGLAHLLLLGGVMLLMWFGLRFEAISRVWRRRIR
jgi:hypothetical protein